MSSRRVNVPGLGRLETFCHAVVAGDFIHVSGTLGTRGEELALVEGGVGPQTVQALKNIERILRECDASLPDLVKVNIFLADMATFPEMNAAYLEVMGADPPARITVGGVTLALGGAVEIDGVAYRP